MNPLLIEVPEEWYTERLHIRKPRPGDGRVVCEAIRASRAELRPWMKFAQSEPIESEIEANLREAEAAYLQRRDLRLLIFARDSGQFVGSSGLHRIDWEVRRFEIGYWIDSRCSGRGFMTEAVQGICDFAFGELGARRVEIRCDSANARSRAIPERLGFELEGILRQNELSMDGVNLRDTCVFAKLGDVSYNGGIRN